MPINRPSLPHKFPVFHKPLGSVVVLSLSFELCDLAQRSGLEPSLHKGVAIFWLLSMFQVDVQVDGDAVLELSWISCH